VNDLFDEASILICENLRTNGHVCLFDVKKIAELTEYIFHFEFCTFSVEQIKHLINHKVKVLLGEADIFDNSHDIFSITFA
jgi:hypothetical protein